MAKVIGKSGSLRVLLEKLNQPGIRSFDTLNDLLSFQEKYAGADELIREKNRAELLEDIKRKKVLLNDLSLNLERAIKEKHLILSKEKNEVAALYKESREKSKKLIYAILNWRKERKLAERLQTLNDDIKGEIARYLDRDIRVFKALKTEIEDKETNTDKWVNDLSARDLRSLKLVHSVLAENSAFVAGAIGEERTIAELSKLPDDYVVINDYERKFSSPIYDRKRDDRIFSIQIDHLVIGPSGIYVIETKNWSENSVRNQDLFSPVKQLYRLNFTIFVLLNKAVEAGKLRGFDQHWGARTISPRSLLVLMGNKPPHAYQHVFILSPSEIYNFIMRGRTEFSSEQITKIVNFLNKKELTTDDGYFGSGDNYDYPGENDGNYDYDSDDEDDDDS